MDATLQMLANLAREHAALVLALTFGLTLLESTAIVGLFIVGTPLLVGVGALAATGELRLWPLIAAATLGGALGYELSFRLGRRENGRLLTLWPFSRRPDWIERSRDFISRRGLVGVAVGRFLPVIRPMAPLLAGVAQMGSARFRLANLASAFARAALLILLGAALGDLILPSAR